MFFHPTNLTGLGTATSGVINRDPRHILIDCKRFEDGPLCRIALPHKISSGTHACWADRRFLTAEADAADAA